MIPHLAAGGAGGTDFIYILLLFTLVVLPRLLQRFRLPSAITSLALGVIAGPVLGYFVGDTTISYLSIFGIVSLFLFAGLDVQFEELKGEKRALLTHLGVGIAVLAVATIVSVLVFGLALQPAALLALALLTPSAGFILDSLGGFGLSLREQFWVRSTAIATELVALLALFVVLQSTTVSTLAISALVLGAMVALLPLAFRLFAKAVVPYAPKSEFAFLIMVAVVCAIVTRELGVYYLVGAFIAGLAAQRFRAQLPAMASEKMIHAVESFASVFVPFYFFHAGLGLRVEDFTLDAFLLGGAFVVIALPVRVLVVVLQRHITLGEGLRQSLRISLPLLPTLVFTLVLAEILREKFQLDGYIVGALVVYTISNTLIPGLIFRAPPPEFTTPAALPEAPPETARSEA